MEGDGPRSTSEDTEIWKGRHNGEVVVLKVLKGPKVTSRAGKTNNVSASDDLQSLS